MPSQWTTRAGGRTLPAQETLLFLDQPAAAAVAAAAEFFESRGLRLTQRSEYSVSVALAEGPHSSEAHVAAPLGADSAGDVVLRSGSAQVAAVPVQVKPEWCRVWVTVNDAAPDSPLANGARTVPVQSGAAGAVAAAAQELVALHKERSDRVAHAVQALERDVYRETRWPEYEARLRAGLRGQGVSDAELEEKLATFKRRWTSLGKKAQRHEP